MMSSKRLQIASREKLLVVNKNLISAFVSRTSPRSTKNSVYDWAVCFMLNLIIIKKHCKMLVV